VLPLRIVETSREGFEEPVVELWRDDDFVGMVFHDGEQAIVQIHPDVDGDVHDLAVDDLLRVLDLARAIVDPEAFDDESFTMIGEAVRVAGDVDEEEGWEDVHPATAALLEEFDPLVRRRSEDGEGFFPRDVAERFIARCEEYGLAVVEMEGFSIVGEELVAMEGLDLVVEPQPVMSPAAFGTYANVTAADTLDSWPDDDDLVVAFVFRQPDGEDIVA